MIYVNHRDVKYGVQFSYENDRLTGTNRVTRNTFCMIYALEDNGDVKNPGPRMGTGVAVQHPSDNFCRDTGRKIALARALDNCGVTDPIMLNKEFRRAIWEGYLNRNVAAPSPLNQALSERGLERDNNGRVFGEGC